MAKKSSKLSLYVGALLFLSLIMGLAMPAQTARAASTLNVDNTNLVCSDVTGAPYCTIQAAIDAASAGDTINVVAGTYGGQINVNKSVTLLGDPGDVSPGPGLNAPVIDGGSAPGDAFLLANGVSNVTIQGFEMRNFTSPLLDGIGNGISAWEASTSNITIQDNYFHHLGYNGVLVGNDGAAGDHNNWLIKGNVIEDFGYIGFELTNTSNSSIEDNIIHMSTPYIGAVFSSARRSESGLTVKNNQIDGTPSTGYPVIYIYAYDLDMPNPNLDGVLIEGNTIATVGTPKQIYIHNIGTGTVTNVQVHKNSLMSLRNLTAAMVDATANWWGAASGPGAGNVVGNVDFDPWFVDAAMTILSDVTPTTVYVDAAYTSGSAGGHIFGYDAFATIQEGVNAVADGGAVNVAAGTYHEQVTITKPLTVTGEDGAVLDGTGLTPTWTTGVKIRSGNVTFDNIDVTNYTQDGITAYDNIDMPNLHITNSKISNIQPGYWGFGIYVGYESEGFGYTPPDLTSHLDFSGLLIEGNEITNTHSSALVVQSLTGDPGTLIVRNNNIHDNTTNDGIWVDCARNLVIENNIVVGNLWGVDFTCIADDWYTLNGPYSPKDITLRGNLISNSTEQGIVLYTAWPGTIAITGNSIQGNGTGVENFLTETVHATANWWGAASGPGAIGTGTGDKVSANVDFTPWLCDGTDTDPAIGFQPNLTNLCPTVKVHIAKYLDGAQADATSAGGYKFPMLSSWSAVNIGSGSGNYVLGNGQGGAPLPYQADTSPMTVGADYTTSEITSGTSMVRPACGAGATYRLVGYKTSPASFDDAFENGVLTTTAPTFTGLTADQYVVVLNETCPTLTAEVKDSLGNPIEGASIIYAVGSPNAGWQTFGVTGADGTVSRSDLNAGTTYHFYAQYNNSTSLQQSVVFDGDDTVTFQTVPVTIKVETCPGVPLSGASVIYGSVNGGFHTFGSTSSDGLASKELFPGYERTFYAHYNNTKSALQTVTIVGQTDPLVTFKTTAVTLYNSGPILYGSVNGGWYTFTKPTMEMFAGTQTFKINGVVTPIEVSGCSMSKAVNILKLKDHNGQPLQGGTARGGFGSNFGTWHVAGSTDANGVLVELRDVTSAPATMSYEMKYNNTTEVKTQDVSTNAVFEFDTNQLTLRMETCGGNPLDGGKPRFGLGSAFGTWWFPYNLNLATGATAPGEVAGEVFPGTYSFEMQYKATADTKLNMAIPDADSLLTWKTTNVTLNYSGDISYGGATGQGVWFTKPSMELLPGTYKVHLQNPEGGLFDLSWSGCNYTAGFATLTYTAGAHGSINGVSPQTVLYGTSGTAVTAVPVVGYHFVDWSDGSTTNPRTDTNVMADIDVTANFAITTFTLDYAAGTGGSLTGNTAQVVNYGGDGTAVTVVPAAGYHFVNWSDGSTANPRTDTDVTANVSVTASFAIDTFTLDYAAGTGGSLTGNTAQVVNYGGDGTAVTAVPSAGYHFVDWSDGSTANPRTDTSVTADVSVTANFAPDEYTLTVNQIGNGSVTPVITTTYHMGDVVELTAVADGGWAFSSWSGCTSTDGSECSVTIAGNRTVTVTFVDIAPPDTTITTFPSNPSDVDSATFTFTGTDNATPSGSLTFDCKLDAGAWEVCTSPKVYGGLANGSHTFLVRAGDAAGNVDATPASYTWTVIVNQPPVADAGGPYFGHEGSSIKLSASKSTDPNNNIVLYEWDLDNDGQFDDATGKTPKFTPSDNGVYIIYVKVTDSNGSSDVDDATVTVRNVRPVITSLCVNSLVRAGTPVHARATFKDPGIQDTFTATWKWGDGTTSTGTVSGHVVSGSHTYNRPGIYLVTITVKDKDGGTTNASRYVIVLWKR